MIGDHLLLTVLLRCCHVFLLLRRLLDELENLAVRRVLKEARPHLTCILL